MNICNQTIIFESGPEHWQKGYTGIKPNTERHLDADEWARVKDADIKLIQIINTESHRTFTRVLTDMTVASVGKTAVWVFSWDRSIAA